jgi:chorismate mutase/prephenate dehydrogenase
MIAGSKYEQQKIYDAAPARKKENILVVGGGGGMGKWLTTFLHRRGHQVSVYDPNRRGMKYRAYRTLETGFRNSSLALICVPLDRVGPVVDRLAERDYPGVVCDIASIKGHVAGSLRAAGKRGLAITSIHPLFGPGTKSLDRKTICLCSCGSRRADERIRALFHGPEIRLVAVSLEDHDRLISYVLGLSHFVNLIFGEVLVRSGYPYRLLAMVASTTFQRQVETAQSVLRENPGLYYAIQRLNPFRDRLYADLIKTTRRVTEIVASGRKSEFARFMKNGRGWLASKRSRS